MGDLRASSLLTKLCEYCTYQPSCNAALLFADRAENFLNLKSSYRQQYTYEPPAVQAMVSTSMVVDSHQPVHQPAHQPVHEPQQPVQHPAPQQHILTHQHEAMEYTGPPVLNNITQHVQPSHWQQAQLSCKRPLESMASITADKRFRYI